MWPSPSEDSAVESLSYRELLTAAEAVAAQIVGHAGPRDRIAVWAANSPEWVVVEYACALAGTVLSSLNPAWTDAEVIQALTLTTPRILFAGIDTRGTDLTERAREIAGDVHDCSPVDLATISLRTEPVTFQRPAVRPGDPFIIQFTSGTTGRPKGAVLSHRSVLNAGNIRARSVHADETDVWLNPVPLHHMSGAVVIVTSALSTGGCYVVMSRFDPARQVALMRATGATRMGGVPTMFYALLETPGGRAAMAAVKSVGLGGAMVPPSLVEQLQDHGATVSLAYAQSECPMVTQSAPAADALHVATTVGVPVPHTELRIRAADGSVLGRDQVGEVCVRSPLTMLGYWNMPEATAEALDAGGFLHTGDLGSIDEDGVLRIKGRAREVIIRGGENIYPTEIENVLQRHPAVEAVAVVGVPSRRWGQEVGAVVQLKDAGHATDEDLTRHAAESLAHFKIPRHWRFTDTMPETASGKIRKTELSSLFHDSESPS